MNPSVDMKLRAVKQAMDDAQMMNEVPSYLNDTMAGLTRLQGIVDYRLGNVVKELASLQDIFRSYVHQQEVKVNQRPALKHGLDFFLNLLTIPDQTILSAIRSELDGTQVEIAQKLEEQRQELELYFGLVSCERTKLNASELLDQLTVLKVRKLPDELHVFTPQILLSRKRELLRKSIATMRKLPKLGACVGDPITFEWPTESDLMSMPLDRPIKLEAIKWKRASGVNQFFLGSVQVQLSNGIVSPLFERSHNPGSQINVNIPDSSLIRKVRGSGHVKEFYLLTANDVEVARIKPGNWPTQEACLEPGEEVIGLYGTWHNDAAGYFCNMSCIVWQPPNLCE